MQKANPADLNYNRRAEYVYGCAGQRRARYGRTFRFLYLPYSVTWPTATPVQDGSGDRVDTVIDCVHGRELDASATLRRRGVLRENAPVYVQVTEPTTTWIHDRGDGDVA